MSTVTTKRTPKAKHAAAGNGKPLTFSHLALIEAAATIVVAERVAEMS